MNDERSCKLRQLVTDVIVKMDANVYMEEIEKDGKLKAMYLDEKKRTVRLIVGAYGALDVLKYSGYVIYYPMIRDIIKTGLDEMANITDYEYDCALRYCFDMIVEGMCDIFKAQIPRKNTADIRWQNTLYKNV